MDLAKASPHIKDGVLHATTGPSMFQLCRKLINMDTKSLDSHKDMANSEKQLKEKSVRSTVRAFSAFTNPFEMSTDASIIVCLSSGKKVSEDVASDMM